MVSAEDLKKDAMWFEAVDRLELMGAKPEDRWMILMNRGLDIKIVVDHKERSVRRQEISEEELNMVKELENKFGFICYYLIKDEGMWPDGCTFPRYSLLYVGENTEVYEMIKEECINECGTIPVYVVNMEDSYCSELTEMKYVNVGGNIINAS